MTEDKDAVDTYLANGGTVQGLLKGAVPLNFDEETRTFVKHYARTNKGSAERLRDAFEDRFAWCPEMGWYAWDKNRGAWREDAEHLVWQSSIFELHDIVEREINEIVGEEEQGKHKAYLHHVQSTHHLEATIKQLGSMMIRSWREYDQKTDRLTVKNGTLVFKDGEVTLAKHDPADLITRCSPIKYNASADHRFWTSSLERFIPDDSVRAFLQRFGGSVLVGGGIREQKLPIMHGSGANGKSTFVHGLRCALGSELALEVDPSTLRPDKRSGAAPSPDRIRLRGARFVYAVEASGNMDAELLKRLTGGEEIVARQLHKKTISFKPTFTLAVVVNDPPSFDDTSEGLWRRIVVIPFNVRIPDSERIDAVTVNQLLAEESEGILSWLVEGYKLYSRDGFSAPDSITLASALMRDEQDYIRVFLREHVKTSDASDCLTLIDLFAEWTRWSMEETEAPKNGKTTFGREVDKVFGERIAMKVNGRVVRGWKGRALGQSHDAETTGHDAQKVTEKSVTRPLPNGNGTNASAIRKVTEKTATFSNDTTDSYYGLPYVAIRTPVFGEDV